VDQLSGGFTSGLTALAADREALLQINLTGARAKVAMAASCRVAKSPQNKAPCELFQFGTTPPGLSGIEQKRTDVMGDLTVLKNYANALAAVTNAADRTAYDAAVA